VTEGLLTVLVAGQELPVHPSTALASREVTAGWQPRARSAQNGLQVRKKG